MAFTKESPHKQDRWIPSRQEIRDFEQMWNEWKGSKPAGQQTWEVFMNDMGCITLIDPYIAPSGYTRCKSYAIRNPEKFHYLSKLYSAMMDYYAKVDYANRKELQELEAKAFPS
jgi:hypothetical protein